MISKASLILSGLGLMVMAVPDAAPSASAPPPAPVASALVAIPEGGFAAEAAREAERETAGEAAETAAGTVRGDPRPEAIRALRITQELDHEHWLHPGEWIWDPDAARAAKGSATVVVNLRSRTLSVYKGGVEIGRSSILYGAPGKDTPLGTFPVLEKKRDHISNIYGAPMPHMMRLTWDGVALHGSALFADDRATNGCVGLPEEFAALLFDHVKLGDKVMVWSGRSA